MIKLLILFLLGEVLYPQLKMRASFTEDRSTFYSYEVFFIRVVLYNPTENPILFPASGFLRGRIAPFGGAVSLTITKDGKPVEQTVWVDALYKGSPPHPRDTMLLEPGDSLVTFVAPHESCGKLLLGYAITEPGNYEIVRIEVADFWGIYAEDSVGLIFKVTEIPEGVKEDFLRLYDRPGGGPAVAADFIRKYPDHPLVKTAIGASGLLGAREIYYSEPSLVLSCAARFPDYFLLSDAYAGLAHNATVQTSKPVDPAFMARLDSVLLANIYSHPYGEEILRWKEKNLGWKIGEKFKKGGN